MNKEYCANLNDLFEIFSERLTPSDIIASKVLGEISATIVKNRTELGMTQKQFAQHLNVSQGMISKWESSDYNFSIKALAEIALKLDLDLDVRIHKSKIVRISDKTEKMNSITSIERRFYVINNNNNSPRKMRLKTVVSEEDVKCYIM